MQRVARGATRSAGVGVGGQRRLAPDGCLPGGRGSRSSPSAPPRSCPPITRKNCTSADAVPRSRCGTVFWMLSRNTWFIRPIPIPAITMSRATSRPSCARSASAEGPTRSPAPRARRAQFGRSRPVREIQKPESTLDRRVPEHHRDQRQPGERRRDPHRPLDEERQVRDRPEHRHPAERDADEARRDRPRAYQAERHDRLGRPPLDEHEDAAGDHRARERDRARAGRASRSHVPPRRARRAAPTRPRRASRAAPVERMAAPLAVPAERWRGSRRAPARRSGGSRRRSSASSRGRRSARRPAGRRSTRARTRPR